MEVEIAQSALKDMLAVMCKVIPKSNVTPIYGGVLLTTGDGVLSMSSTDSVKSVMCTRVAHVEDGGEAILPGILLHDTVKQMPDEVVRISTNGNGCAVTCGKVRLRPVQLELAEADLLRFPSAETEVEVSLPTDLFAFMADGVCKCVAKEQFKPMLCGVHIVSKDGALRMQSSDTFRVLEVSTESDLGEFDAIVSTDCLGDAASLARGETVSIRIGEGRAFVSSDDMIHAGRVIVGAYPNVNALLRRGSGTSVTFDPDELGMALKRVRNVANDSNRVRISVEGGTMSVLAASQASGEVCDEIEVDTNGNDFQTWYGYRFLCDGVSAMSGETLLTTDGPSSPMMMESHDRCDVRYVLSPLRG